MKVDIIKFDGKKAGNMSLKDNVFNIEPRDDIMSRVVNWQLSKRTNISHHAWYIAGASARKYQTASPQRLVV